MFSTIQKSTYIAYIMVICLLLVLMIGCSSSPTASPNGNKAGQNGSESAPKKGGTVTIGLKKEPDSLDVQKSSVSEGQFIGSLMGGSLLYEDPKTREIKPYLAESYTVSEDGKTLKFILRSGVTFHDGTPLTAKVYKETFDRALAPDMASSPAGNDLSAVKSVSAPDDRTLIMELKEPSATLLFYLSSPDTLQPLSTDAIKKFNKEYDRNPVGVGQWKFESWKTGESITLVRNEAFNWAIPALENQGPARPDKLVFKFIKDPQAQMAAIESGSIDIARGIPPKDAHKYKNHDKFILMEYLKSGISFVVQNTENEILKDSNVRRAFNLAINKKAIIQAEINGEGVPANGPLPASIFGYDSSIEQYAYKYNVEEAKKQLDAAGWKETAQGIREKDGKKLKLSLLASQSTPGNALIQNMLKEVGVDLQIQNVEHATAIEMAANGKFDLFKMEYGAHDPDILYMLLHSSQIGGFNFFQVNNKQLDALLEKGRTTLDTGERQKIYEEVQKIVVDQAYLIPLYTEKKYDLVNKRIEAVKLDQGNLMLNDMWVNE
ncbi:ABC transporter substrate-binding protein [Brevibacillus reuszeri]|uniref:ABC transporter substrate-binding protein n=1 Tax=Brevibacillus reuszeri TaxID=54915 RepID=UPI00366ECB8D